VNAAASWAEALASWAIPPEILEQAPQDPWAYPVGHFVRSAEDAMTRDTPSYRSALAGMPVGGTILDVGCGAGAASLPLAPPASHLIGVDEEDAMLDAFAKRAGALGVAHTEVQGRWPDVKAQAPIADVVVCHHVLYNVSDLEPFVAALTDRARRRIVVELTAEHPRSWMNPLWRELHGIERPDRPTADDAIDVLNELGMRPHVERWQRPMHSAEAPEEEQVAMVRVALCLRPERNGDVARALAAHPPPPVRGVVTIWWES
jgi:SAM-dependent methyltransferase